MDCAEVREALLPLELGTLSPEEVAELEEHAAACSGCGALADASEEALRILRDWRAATDAPLDEAEVEGLIAGLAAIESARAERSTARRSVREAAPPKRGAVVLYALGALTFIGVGVAAWFLTQGQKPQRPDPLRDLAPGITDAERARDAACVIDVVLLDEWKFATPNDRRIAALGWARAMARREGFAARCAFVRAALGAEAGSPTDGAAGGADALRLAGDLEGAGLYAAAASECERVVGAATTDLLRRRAKLHLAAALLRGGKLGQASRLLDELAPPPPVPAEGEEPAPAPPRDFIGRLADILRARADEALAVREKLAGYEGARGRGSDDRGGKMAVDALELDRALELLEGEDPSWMGPLVRGWVRLMRGDVEGSEADLDGVAAEGQRYHKSLARLGLAEGAFLEGRFASARRHLRRAAQTAAENFNQGLFETAALRHATHSVVDFGSRVYFDQSDLDALEPEEGPAEEPTAPAGDDEEPAGGDEESAGGDEEPAGGDEESAGDDDEPAGDGDEPVENDTERGTESELKALVDAVIVPRVGPLAAARDAVTKDWPALPRQQGRPDFGGVLGDPKPGTVDPRTLLKLDFESGAAGLDPATAESEVEIEEAGGLEKNGLRVSAAGRSAAARLVFDEPFTEVETWVLFAVRLESAGGLAVWAKEAGGDGALFRWRTVSLAAGRWHRLAIPLGALEPERPAGGDQSLLAKRVFSVGFSMLSLGNEPAAFVLDDLLIHHGEPPKGADDRPRPEQPPE